LRLMYPLLLQRKSFLLYLACWLPCALLIAALVVYAGQLEWIPALVFALPMTVVYAFLCLSTWHLCRYFPLENKNVLRLLVVQLSAGFIGGIVWILVGLGLVTVAGAIPPVAQLPERYPDLVLIVFVIGILLFLLGSAISYMMISFEKNREMEKRSLELRFLAQQAEMKALKAQIDPHFLFNSLNSISALTSIDPSGSREMCLLLSDFLRKSLKLGAKKCIALEEEFALVSDYIAIEKIRMGPKLATDIRIEEDCKGCAVPPLLLQPLVENALNHGIRHLVEGGEVVVRARKDGKRLQIIVENPQDPEKPMHTGEGIGLDNIRGRLRTLYEAEARLECIESGNNFRVLLSLPAKTEQELERESIK
jgi:two-component system sensor histidine kinase AlgZ